VGARLTVFLRSSMGLVSSAMLIGGLLWVRWSSFDGASGIDLQVYRRGGMAILRGEPLYDVSVNGLHFTYSPFAAVLFTSLSAVPIEVARWLVTGGSLACYIAVVFVCARSVRIGWLSGIVVGAAGLTLEPLFTGIDLGQIDLYLILLITLDCLVIPARHRGWLVGLAAGLKLVPGAFVLYFIVKRDWPAVGKTAAGFAVTVLCGALVAPGDSWRYWSGGLMDVSRFGDGVALRADNQSLSAEYIRLSHDVTPPTAVLIGLSALALLVAAVVAKRRLESDRPLEAMVALGLGSVLASPVSWTHHWLWVVPLLVVTVSRRWWIMSWALGIVFLIAPMALVPMGNSLELNHNWWQSILSSCYVVFGILLLVRLFLVGTQRTGDVLPSTREELTSTALPVP